MKKTHFILNVLLAVAVVVLFVVFLKSRNAEKLDTNQAVDVVLKWTTYTDVDGVMVISRDTMTFYAEQAEKLYDFVTKLK